jgi:hypothetical protein
MISAWTRWRISTAIEKGRPLSPALARAVRRDPECRWFYEASLAMASRLPGDVEEVVRNEEAHSGDVRPLELGTSAAIGSPGQVRRWRLTLPVSMAALAIGLVLGGIVWWWTSPPEAGPPRAVQASDVAELTHIIRQMKDNVDRVAERKAPQWQRLLSRSGEALRTPMVREAENMAADTRQILRAFSSMLPRDGPRQRPEPRDDGPPPSSSGSDVPASPAGASLACARPTAMIPL